jgi:hypothetical protein
LHKNLILDYSWVSENYGRPSPPIPLPTSEHVATSQAKTYYHVQPETIGHTIFGVGWAWRRGVVGVAWVVPVYCSVSLGLNLGFGLMLGILSGIFHTIL